MTLALTKTGALSDGFFDGAIRTILDHQLSSGAIPWHDDGVFDPWNHVESAMGLGVAGHHAAAARAFDYLADTQEPDGSWWGAYHGDVTGKLLRDSNFCAYVATGVWHSFLLTRDRVALAARWPVVEKAITFVLSLQSPMGDVRWAAPDPLTPEDDSLIAGCASIFKSVECALAVAQALGQDRPQWSEARRRLGRALRHRPERFDRHWPSKANFSMSWYYPVLTGVLRGEDARRHLRARWSDFVADGKGCRCVQEQPWVTVAEGAELAIALAACGLRTQAHEMLAWQHQWRDSDGGYWMGHQFVERVHWPALKPSWTAAAVLLAADTLTGATPAARLFIEPAWSEPSEQRERSDECDLLEET